MYPGGRAIVVGAGAVGLATAIELLECGFDVHVIGEKMSPATTSDGSGGYWRPVFLEMDPAMLLRISEYSFTRMINMMTQGEHTQEELGMRLVSGYEFYKSAQAPEVPCWSNVVFGFRNATKEEIATFCPHATHGFHYTTIIVEPPKYLTWMHHRIRSLGGTVSQQTVRSLAEAATLQVHSRRTGAAEPPTLVVNCGGLNGGLLAGDDTSVVPIRGQILKVKPHTPSHSRHFLIDLTKDHEVAYILPRDDCCILGGTEQVGDYNTSISERDTADILHKCDIMMPGIRHAQIVTAWAGLRPSRTPVRMELKMPAAHSQGPSVPILHNYGHGGSGLTIHWGCARECIELLRAAGMVGANKAKL